MDIVKRIQSDSVIRWLWMTVFAGCSALCLLWLWLQPQAFPVGHPRFLANLAIPLAVLSVALLGLASVWRRWLYLGAASIVFLCGLAYSGVIAAFTRFPISFGPSNGLRFLVLILFTAIFLTALSSLAALFFLKIFFLVKRKRLYAFILFFCATVLSLVAGVNFVLAQQSLPAATMPLNQVLPNELLNLPTVEVPSPQPISFAKDNLVWPASGHLQTNCGELAIEISPLITFRDRSPDRFWTIFAPPAISRQQYQLVGQEIANGQVLLSYAGAEQAWIKAEQGEQGLSIEGYTQLSEPVYSHLNSYAAIRIYGREALALSFDNIDSEPIAFTVADYPFGKPARLAYRDLQGQFSVVEASNAEKGPFRTLAKGQLAQKDELALSLYSGDRAQCSIVLEDWASQASTQLSPTAGWGLPENAIAFQLVSRGLEIETAILSVTLSNTSTGRGFDSSGHAAGLYRNKMRIE